MCVKVNLADRRALVRTITPVLSSKGGVRLTASVSAPAATGLGPEELVSESSCRSLALGPEGRLDRLRSMASATLGARWNSCRLPRTEV